MSAIVTVDAHAGTLTRYEIGGQLRKTHFFEAPADEYPRPVTFEVETVESFRHHPPGDFYCGPPLPNPGGDNPGGTPGAVHTSRPLAA